MKTIVDITPLESLRISQPFLFLPMGTGTWAASTPTWIPQLISPSRNFHAGKWSTCIQLLPSRVLGGGPHSGSERGPWKPAFAVHEEQSWESNLVPAPSSIGFSCCWTALFQPMLEKFAEFVFVIPSVHLSNSKVSRPPSPLSVLGGTLRSRVTEQALWADDSVSPSY